MVALLVELGKMRKWCFSYKVGKTRGAGTLSSQCSVGLTGWWRKNLENRGSGLWALGLCRDGQGPVAASGALSIGSGCSLGRISCLLSQFETFSLVH